MINKDSPFNSSVFIAIWNKHFNKKGRTFTFHEFSNISFIKKAFGVYVNVGKRISQGIFYTFYPSEHRSISKNAVYLIYDVPSYHDVHYLKDRGYRLKRIKQYDGYAINLESYKGVDDYFNQQFRSKSRSNFNKSFKNFNDSFEVSNEVLIGPNVDYNKYVEILNYFQLLLQKRFDSKKELYPFLESTYWDYLHELIYELIKERKAVIFVMYANRKPVSIHINYISKTTVILAYPVFDIDYSSYKIGHLTTYYSLQWCFQNGIKFYDFSKEYFLYKKRWGNMKYVFDYHIIYNKNNLFSFLIANALIVQFKIKQLFRSMNIDLFYHKLKNRFIR